MSLQNSLYHIQHITETEAVITFDASHPIFAGHFPGRPIVPGACMVQIAEELTAILLGRPVQWNTIKNLKFRYPVTPEMEVRFAFQFAKENAVSIQLTTTDHTCASFSATYMCIDSDL